MSPPVPQNTPQPEPIEQTPVWGDILQCVHSLGRVIGNCRLYGIRHSLSVTSMEHCFERLTRVLPKVKEITIIVTDDELVVNDGKPDPRHPHAMALRKHLSDNRIPGLRIVEGLDPDEFVRVMNFLAAPEAGAHIQPAAERLAEANLPHVSLRAATYRQVYDDQAVVDKKVLEAFTDGPAVQQIIAFLKGDFPADQPSPLPGLEAAAAHTDKLADLILKATEGRLKESADVVGESLGDLLVASLRRTCDGLAADPAAKTQKGKKTLSKTLAVLQQDLIKRLRELAGPDAAAAAEQVAACHEELQDGINAQAIVDEYARRRRAMDAAEDRLRRYLKTAGADSGSAGEMEIRSQLEDVAGLTPEGWQTLMAQSRETGGGGKGAGLGGDTGLSEELRMLTLMLTELSHAMDVATSEENRSAAAKAFQQTLEQAGTRAAESAARAEQALQAYAKEARSPAPTPEAELSRRQLLSMLAEIVQELRQPLSVINCGLDMLVREKLGASRESRTGIMNLMASNLERVITMIDSLEKVSGVPDGLAPDRQMLDGLERSVKAQDAMA